MSGLVNIKLNGRDVTVEKDLTIMEAARRNGIYIPNLCNHPDQRVKAHCRICSVEVNKGKNLVTACSTKVAEGMAIQTNTSKVREARRTILELIFADHPQDCLTCIRNGNCELRQLAVRLGVSDIKGNKKSKFLPMDLSTTSIVKNPNKCIKCGRCSEVCHSIQEVGILYILNRSVDVSISPEYGKTLSEVDCVLCGQCVLACPVGAIHEKDDTDLVWDAIADPGKHVIVQVAPSVRVSMAEEFDMPIGSIETGRLVSALRSLGFDRVFDTNFTADLTIMEEGSELLYRIKNGGVLPMITSCSPGWINYIEKYYPEHIPHLSSCKSPQQMFGAIAKTYYPKVSGIPAEDIFVVSIMPCTAKKYEASRPEMNSSGFRDVDAVLTTRELARMLKHDGIAFDALPNSDFDSPLGLSTGAAALFGATGGVMEAALRTVYEAVTGEELQKLEFSDVRGMDGIKSSSVNLGGTEVKVAIAHGLANAKKIMESIKGGASDYTFIEVMCCPGGCIGGGGQPYTTTSETRKKRAASIYKIDEYLTLRKSHENPDVKKLYDNFLSEPLSEQSHRLLHTKYNNHRCAPDV